MKELIYLDYNATTPVDKQVLNEMLPFFRDKFGNPSSMHSQGKEARIALTMAREKVACCLNCSPEEIIFTGSATEANNLVLKGIAAMKGKEGGHIIISAIEHPSVMETCSFLTREGCRISYFPVNRQGVVDPEELVSLIGPGTVLISVMHANNEIGSIQPIKELAAVARGRGILFHSDAAQSLGKIEVDVQSLGVDFLTIAGHKIYAPKGIGALYIRQGLKEQIKPLLHGGGQEYGLRPGTENLPYIVALGKACQLIREKLETYQKRMKVTRDLLVKRLHQELQEVELNLDLNQCLPNTASVRFKNCNGADLIKELADQVALSAGAACHADTQTPSYVLRAIGLSDQQAFSTIRFSTGRFTTEAEIERAVELIRSAYKDCKNRK